MSATPKLMIAKRNTTYFVKNHEILLNYFNDMENIRLGNMRFLVCVKIVFHTLHNQRLHETLTKA